MDLTAAKILDVLVSVRLDMFSRLNKDERSRFDSIQNRFLEAENQSQVLNAKLAAKVKDFEDLNLKYKGLESKMSAENQVETSNRKFIMKLEALIEKYPDSRATLHYSGDSSRLQSQFEIVLLYTPSQQALGTDDDKEWVFRFCEHVRAHPKPETEINIVTKQNSDSANTSAIRIADLHVANLAATVHALCRTEVIVPVLSWIERRNGSETTYSGSLGQLVGLEPRRRDRMDPFLVQVAVANALLALPSQWRMVHSVHPIFSKLETSGDGCQSLSHAHILQLLSTDPSIKTNEKAAELLRENGMPVVSGMLQRSVRENIARLLDLCGDGDKLHLPYRKECFSCICHTFTLRF
jgi:hypothetical protein